MPIIKAAQAVRTLAAGELVESSEHDGVYRFVLRRK
jgi:TusA-related sulfurtransferase